MTEKQIKEYERLSKLKEQYKMFISKDGDVSFTYYSHLLNDNLNARVDDDEFKDLVKTLAKKRLENINKQIEKL